MKNVFLKMFTLMLLLVSFTTIASTLTVIQEGTVESVNFLTLAIDYAKFTFLTMLILAANHIVAGTFSLSIWFKDSLLPALLAYGGGLAIAALDIYATSWDFFVEGIIGVSTDYTDFTNLALTGMVLVAFIKGLFKINQTKAKVKAKASN